MKTEALPEWLQKNSSIKLPENTSRCWRTDYLEKTLRRIQEILSEETEAVSVSRKLSLLQDLETHAKLLGTLTLLVAAALTKQVSFLVGINLLLFGVAVYVGLGAKSFASRVYLPVFFFTGLAVLPGILSWITPGESLYTVYSGLHFQVGWIAIPDTLSISKQGVQSAFFVTLRSACSLGLATLLLKTTNWSLITKALAKFGLPSALVAVLDLTYRYIFLFLRLLLEYIMGRKSRLVGVEAHADKLAWIGRTIANFLRITNEYSQDINHAMQSRGYTGEYYAQRKLEIGRRDIYFLAVVAIICYFA